MPTTTSYSRSWRVSEGAPPSHSVDKDVAIILTMHVKTVLWRFSTKKYYQLISVEIIVSRASIYKKKLSADFENPQNPILDNITH